MLEQSTVHARSRWRQQAMANKKNQAKKGDPSKLRHDVSVVEQRVVIYIPFFSETARVVLSTEEVAAVASDDDVSLTADDFSATSTSEAAASVPIVVVLRSSRSSKTGKGSRQYRKLLKLSEEVNVLPAAEFTWLDSYFFARSSSGLRLSKDFECTILRKCLSSLLAAVASDSVCIDSEGEVVVSCSGDDTWTGLSSQS